MRFPKSNFLLLLVVMLSIGNSSFGGPSCSGGECSGGGASVCTKADGFAQDCNELLDAHMLRNRFIVENSEAYKEIVKPILDQLQKDSPDFVAEFRASLSQKRWYLTNSEIPALSPATNGTDLKTKQVAVQYQNAKEVWISRPWFDSRGKQEQAAIILHEMGVDIMLKQRTGASVVNDEAFRRVDGLKPIQIHNVRALVELLLTNPRVSDVKLQKSLFDLNFGAYLTGERKEKFLSYKRGLIGELARDCALPEDKDLFNSKRNLAVGSTLDRFEKNLKQLWKKYDQAIEADKKISTKIEINALNRLIQAITDGADAAMSHVLPYELERNGEGLVALGRKNIVRSFPDGTKSPIQDKLQIDMICNYAKDRIQPSHPASERDPFDFQSTGAGASDAK